MRGTRRSSPISITEVRSRSRIWAAAVDLIPVVSIPAMAAMPLRPARRAAAKASRPMPLGLTTPRPVMTTFLRCGGQWGIALGTPGEGWGEASVQLAEEPSLIPLRSTGGRGTMNNNVLHFYVPPYSRSDNDGRVTDNSTDHVKRLELRREIDVRRESYADDILPAARFPQGSRQIVARRTKKSPGDSGTVSDSSMTGRDAIAGGHHRTAAQQDLPSRFGHWCRHRAA